MSYSVKEIKAAQAQKREYDRQFPLSFYVVRPLSLVVTWALLKVTRSPSRVAYWGLAVGLAGCVALLFLPELSLWPGFMILAFYILLDASDGNIARVTHNVTYYGRFLDGVVGEIVDGGYFFWLGLGMYRKASGFGFLDSVGGSFVISSNLVLLLAGVIITLGRLYSARITITYYSYYRIKQGERAGGEDNLNQTIGSSQYRKFWWYRLFINVGSIDLQMALLALCGTLNLVDALLLFYAAYYSFQSLLLTAFYLRRAQKRLS